MTTTAVRTVTLPTGRRVSNRNYLRALAMAKAHPDHLFADNATVRLMGGAVTGRDFVRMYRRGLHDRISSGIPYANRGSVTR